MINKVIRVDQQPLGQTPTSNPATFTGVFDLIRTLYAQLPDAKVRGYTARRFSFNVPGGRCEKCEGNGQLKIEMHFLPDVWVECDVCQGKRYNPETLAVKYHGQSIADVLAMSCDEAARLFENIPKVRKILQPLVDVGLSYITLGQPAPTLSGGEAQRVKLAAELSRPDTGQTLYLLDEPTTGLHFDDIAKLLDVLNRLVDLGNTIVVIEHNLDVIKTADWVLEIGPEAGAEGGHLVVAGTPEDVVAHARAERAAHGAPAADAVPPKRAARKAKAKPEAGAVEAPPAAALLRSHTGEALDPVLTAGPYVERKRFDFAAAEAPRTGDLDITEVGRDSAAPWEVDGLRWHTHDRVGRNGAPCRWDGRILAEVVERIMASDLCSDPDWNSRTVVEICGQKKSDGWFFHAITGEEWLLKMKFRTGRNTFRRDEVVTRLDLKPLNDMPDLPLYGTEPRVRCRNLHGPWQEIELRVHSYQEIDRPEFWKFVDDCIAGFGQFTQRVQENPDNLMPWKVLGRKWHFTRKGFVPGRSVSWEPEVLEELFAVLEEMAPAGQFLWNNKQVVPVYVPEQKEPWAAVQTKKLDAVWLHLTGPKGRFALGRLTGLGYEPELDGSRPDADIIRLKFTAIEQLRNPDFRDLLGEHVKAVQER